MTERKPPGTSWETWIEAQIRVAREQGAFDNLPGAGKPLPYLGQEYDPDWWVKQLVQREQISILCHRSKYSARWTRSSPRSRSSTTKRPSVVGSPLSTSRSPRSTRPCWRGRRRASAHWMSIRSWRVGGEPAPPILAVALRSHGLPKATRSANAMKPAVRASAPP